MDSRHSPDRRELTESEANDLLLCSLGDATPVLTSAIACFPLRNGSYPLAVSLLLNEEYEPTAFAVGKVNNGINGIKRGGLEVRAETAPGGCDLQRSRSGGERGHLRMGAHSSIG